jgi:hypothetical protein
VPRLERTLIENGVVWYAELPMIGCAKKDCPTLVYAYVACHWRENENVSQSGTVVQDDSTEQQVYIFFLDLRTWRWVYLFLDLGVQDL